MVELKDLVDQLTRAYPALSPQVRRAAEFVLENPTVVATQSMRRVAAAADVPPPTMARLAKSVDFNTYEAFRDVYRRGLHGLAGAYPERARVLQEGAEAREPDTLWHGIAGSAIDNLNNLYNGVDPALMQRAGERLAAARKVYVVGMLASFSAAHYLRYVGHLSSPKWVLVPGQGGTVADEVTDLGAEDAVVAIALVPYAQGTVRLARFARKRGTDVIAITDSRTSPLARHADYLFLAPTETPQFFESYVATTAILEGLVAHYIAAGDPAMIENIETAERRRERLGEYWDERAEASARKEREPGA